MNSTNIINKITLAKSEISLNENENNFEKSNNQISLDNESILEIK